MTDIEKMNEAPDGPSASKAQLAKCPYCGKDGQTQSKWPVKVLLEQEKRHEQKSQHICIRLRQQADASA